MIVRTVLLLIFSAVFITSAAQDAQPELSHVVALSDVRDGAAQDTAATPEIKASTHVAVAKPQDPLRLSSQDRRKRKRKSKTKRHTISTMNYEELREAKNRKIEEKNIEIAIKYAEKMLPLCKDMYELKDLTIELANLYFEAGKLEQAGKLYNEFCKLYPGDDHIEHAYHKAILCAFYGMLDASRDQTKTHETLALTTKFLERADVFTTFAVEVATIEKKCQQRLIDSELSIMEFYLNRGSFVAAQNRINGLRKEYSPTMHDLEPQLITYEIQIAERKKDPVLLAQKRAELEEKFPLYSQVTMLAQADKKQVNFADKF